MWLIFSSVSSSGEPYTHGLRCTELEGHFEVLNSFVAAGYQLLSAFLVDQGHRMDLPLEAFDGSPMRDPLHQLQEQYQQVLGPST
ncbi:hypothetical protein ACFQ4C_21560 [Larkinella insperata]|uniref:Uncharacterized protein n=1 Tax=Larkinella insperata TaxID=332158 RepID=A0ABW3QEU4_9BACT